MEEHINIFVCPACKGDLKVAGEQIQCFGCGNHYPVEQGIPRIFLPNEPGSIKKDVTQKEKNFYETTPFPNYENLENVGDLVQKAQNSIFARLLNDQVPVNIRVLEVGCGTGQLSNDLSVANRFVFGTDMCLNSLKLAHNFKVHNQMERVGFYQMNLFRPIFKEESFPLVICNGVLHHTGDPLGGFRAIAKLVKKGGYILIGLYNTYGRIFTDIRRGIFKLSGDRFKFLDSRLMRQDVGDLRKLAWFRDQYKNPHESKHTMGEVLRWFEEEGFDFINGIPKLNVFNVFSRDEKLFKANPKGNRLDHFFVQSGLAFSGIKEGGFFIMIGKRRN